MTGLRLACLGQSFVIVPLARARVDSFLDYLAFPIPISTVCSSALLYQRGKREPASLMSWQHALSLPMLPPSKPCSNGPSLKSLMTFSLFQHYDLVLMLPQLKHVIDQPFLSPDNAQPTPGSLPPYHLTPHLFFLPSHFGSVMPRPEYACAS